MSTSSDTGPGTAVHLPPREAWSAISDLIERVSAESDLLESIAEEVRSSIREIAGVEAADVARHTRALLSASTRAIEARRGPTEAELGFVADLAVTRARQGVPIHAVLSGIRIAERRIWARAVRRAGEAGISADLVLQARELYDDWAHQVRERLLLAHRAAEADESGHPRGRALVRRLLEGGAPAALAAAEAGLPGMVVVGVAPGLVGAARESLISRVSALPATVATVDAGEVVVVSRGIRSTGSDSLLVLAGPGPVEEVPVLRRLAVTGARAAATLGRRGVVHVGEVASLAALWDRADLAAALVEHHGAALARLGRNTAANLDTVRSWLEHRQDTEATASACFVHPNTVRNRVHAVVELTGLDPRDPFAAVDLWWLCSTWPERHVAGG